MKTGLEKFQESLNKEANKFIDKIFNKHRDGFSEVFGNYLADSDGPKYLHRNLSREEKFFTEFFYLFAEILRIYEFLLDIEVYIGRFPYQSTRITKIGHLRYHIEHYLNEIYIIKTRMVTLLTKLKRMYKKDERIENIKITLSNTEKIIEESLKKITTKRGEHVHVNQFNTIDLKRLDTFELISTSWHGDDKPKFKFYYDFFYKDLRKKWKADIVEANINLKTLIDSYFDSIYDILFDKDRNFIYPPNIKYSIGEQNA